MDSFPKHLRWLFSEEHSETYVPGGYHPTTINSEFQDRYQVVRKLGWGIQSTIWLVNDMKSNASFLTLKILSAEATSQSGKNEVDVLNRLTTGNALHPGYALVGPSAIDSFYCESRYGRHLCIVMDVMGINVASFASYGLFSSREGQFPEFVTKRIMHDILQGLDYCHTEALVVHTDMKLSNIVTVTENGLRLTDDAVLSSIPEICSIQAPDGNVIKITKSAPFVNIPIAESVEEWKKVRFAIIDFGRAVMAQHSVYVEYNDTPISSAVTRSPEAFIHGRWNASTDIWSAGIICFQLLTNTIFYPQGWRESLYPIHLYKMFGPFPKDVLASSTIGGAWFDKETGILKVENVDTARYEEPLNAILEAIPEDYRPSEEAIDFQMQILTLDPAMRPTAQELLAHPWLVNAGAM